MILMPHDSTAPNYPTKTPKTESSRVVFELQMIPTEGLTVVNSSGSLISNSWNKFLLVSCVLHRYSGLGRVVGEPSMVNWRVLLRSQSVLPQWPKVA